MHDRSAPVRVDRWLWAARLVKTRTLGADAARGGRVHVNGIAVKPSKEIQVGDRLELTTGPLRRTVVVRGTAQRRGPVSEAVTLYEETAESREARERLAQERRLAAPTPVGEQGGRPTKRDRRRFENAARSYRRER
jgi:ribosome-associated heat shock protein Hsp15